MLAQLFAQWWFMSQLHLEFERIKRSAVAPSERLTPDHIELLECTLAGTPPWECLPDVVCLITYLDQLVARQYLVVRGCSYGITERGRQLLAAVKLPLA